MTAALPRRIQRLAVRIRVPHSPSPADREKLERAAYTCPVHESLHLDVQIPIEFTWE
jgi:putative redox protein